MNRREVLLNTSAMAIAASLGAIACGAQNAAAQAAVIPAAPGGGLVDTGFDCQRTGEACAEHCVRMLATGDTSMAECLLAVREMLPATAALAHLAGMSSKLVPAAARLALDACESCQAACRKHAEVHFVCRDCADSCARTIAACRKVAA
jgi:Cys-rich four helix bundle protein (predicted Tat secretion target)